MDAEQYGTLEESPEMIVLEIIGGAVVLEIAVQAAWHLGARRFWRPDPPRCIEIMKFSDHTHARCRADLDHEGPHEFRIDGLTYYRENPRKKAPA